MILAEELIDILKTKKEDVKFVDFQNKIINTRLKIIGVKVPLLRKIAKELYHSQEIVEFNHETDQYFECVVLEGFLIAFEKDKGLLKDKLGKYLKKMDNWAVVDMVCSSLICFKNKAEISDFDYFESLLSNENEFVVRFGIVCLLKFFSADKFNDKVLNSLKSVKCGNYYVDMAIAWLISELIIKNAQNAEKIMKKVLLINNFNSFIVNKSVDKVRDSFRVNKEIKEKLRKMKIK